MEKFEKDVMQYLRNIVTKLIILNKRMDKLEDGFRCTSVAFKQIKTVVQAVVNEVELSRDELSEYGGVIQADTFFDPPVRTVAV